MENQTLINISFALAGGLGGWILGVVWDEIKTLQETQKDIEREMSDAYVRKEDYRIDIAEIKGMLSRIFDKLDNKADK